MVPFPWVPILCGQKATSASGMSSSPGGWCSDLLCRLVTKQLFVVPEEKVAISQTDLCDSSELPDGVAVKSRVEHRALHEQQKNECVYASGCRNPSIMLEAWRGKAPGEKMQILMVGTC